MFRSFFETYGFDIQVSTSSEEALGLLEKNVFDAVICDVMLEELDGFDLLHIARKKHSQIGFVLITGSPAEKDRARAAMQNAGYLTKPVGFEELLHAVESSLRIENTSVIRRTHQESDFSI